MIAVLDANAALELVFKQSLATYITTEVESASVVIAPDLYVSEVSNAFWKYSRQLGQPNPIDSRLLDSAIDLVDEYVPARDLYREAYAFSLQWSHPVYDSMYLVLARRNAALLITIDKRLRELATKNHIKLVSLK